MDHGSVTHWMTALKGGDAAAAQPLWERYHRQLVSLARHKLQVAKKRHADEEDVVQNAFHSFFLGIAKGKYPQLDDRDNLWRLLVLMTARKALDQVAYERSKRRGGGTSAEQSRINPVGDNWEESALAQVVGDEPTPAFAAQVSEQYHLLLESLADKTLQRVAIWKMEGWTDDQIAKKLDCSRRTIARKLDTIRIIWKSHS